MSGWNGSSVGSVRARRSPTPPLNHNLAASLPLAMIDRNYNFGEEENGQDESSIESAPFPQRRWTRRNLRHVATNATAAGISHNNMTNPQDVDGTASDNSDNDDESHGSGSDASFSTSSSSGGSSSSTSNSGSSGGCLSSNMVSANTMAAAVVAMNNAFAASTTERPVLLGHNRDGTLNVRLPSGTVIVVSAIEFPQFNSIIRKNRVHSERNAAVPVSTTERKRTESQRVRPSVSAQQRSTVRTTDKATVDEIAKALPAAASCVFHIFDRRVNLDSFHDADSVTTYALLRAWAQDDPYRCRGPCIMDIPNPIATIGIAAPSAAMSHSVRPSIDSEVDSASTAVVQLGDCAGVGGLNPTNGTHGCHTGPGTTESPSVPALTTTATTVEGLRNDLVRGARQIKRQRTRSFWTRDALVMRSLKERGIELNE